MRNATHAGDALPDLDDVAIVRAATRHYVCDVGRDNALNVAPRQCEVRRDGGTVRVRLATAAGGTITIYVVRLGARGLAFDLPTRAPCIEVDARSYDGEGPLTVSPLTVARELGYGRGGHR